MAMHQFEAVFGRGQISRRIEIRSASLRGSTQWVVHGVMGHYVIKYSVTDATRKHV